MYSNARFFLVLPTSNLVMMHGPYFQVENETNYGQNIPMWSHAMKLDAVGLTFLIIRGLDTYIF